MVFTNVITTHSIRKQITRLGYILLTNTIQVQYMTHRTNITYIVVTNSIQVQYMTHRTNITYIVVTNTIQVQYMTHRTNITYIVVTNSIVQSMKNKTRICYLWSQMKLFS